MLDLVFDRTSQDASALRTIRQKAISNGWDSLTNAEQALWLYGGSELLYDKNGEIITDNTGDPLSVYSGVVKGAYNYTDLNRVGSAVAYLRDELAAVGCSVSVLPKTDWTITDVFRAEDAERYLGNISVLRAALSLPASTPSVPSDMDDFSFTEANNIERLLSVLEQMIINIGYAAKHSGAPFSFSGMGGLRV